MKTMLCVSVLGATLIGSVGAMAATAYTDDNVTINAGPGSAYPVISHLPTDTRVWVNGCRQALDWCDVSHGRLHGWVSADRLMVPRDGENAQRAVAQGDLPVVRFDLQQYWHENYKNRDFYRDLAEWEVRSQEFAANTKSDRIGIAEVTDGR